MIDCFFVGHNEIDFVEYEKQVKKMGSSSGAYRDLRLQYVYYEDVPYTLSDILNFYVDSCVDKFGYKNIFSATIAYLGSFLDKHKLSFDFVNTFKEEKEYLKRKLEEGEIRAIAIPTTYYVSSEAIIEIVDFIKTYNQNVKIIIGGPYIATQFKVQDEEIFKYLCKMIDADFYINSSQGEMALVNILKCIRDNAGFDCIDNIIYKKDDDYVINNMIRENNELQENPIRWKLFQDRITSHISVRTAISCPFSCAFCGFPEHAGEYQYIDEEKICCELDEVVKLNKVTCINFLDDTFNVPPDRFKRLLRKMIDRGYTFKWNSFFRCQFADEEMISLMKESGCEGVFLGIESGNQQILQNMNKRVKIEDLKKGMELLKKYDILTYASFIVGYPGETRETVQDTIDFIETMKPDFYRAQLWYCDPFTPIWNKKNEYGIVNSQFEWVHNAMSSHEAADYVDKIFCEVKNSIWLPQNNFDYPSLFMLLNNGWSIEKIKELIGLFNLGVKDNILNDNNIDYNLLSQMQEVISSMSQNSVIDDDILSDFDF